MSAKFELVLHRLIEAIAPQICDDKFAIGFWRHSATSLIKALALVVLLASTHSGWALDPQRAIASYGRQTWRTENGLPQNTVHAIVQTRDGYIWLATDGGLTRFDGLKFTVFDTQTTEALKSDRIRSLLEDRRGWLWIATANGLTVYDNGTFRRFSTADGLPTNNVWSIYEDSAGLLWVLTAEGLARHQGGRFTVDGRPKGAVLSVGGIAQDPHGVVWVATQNGVRLMNGNGFPAPVQSGAWPTGTITAILAQRDGRLWMGSPAGLSVFHDGKVELYTVRQGLPSNRIVSLYEDRRGCVWIGTEAGPARMEQGQIGRGSSADPLSSSVVLSWFEDNEGSLWAGIDAGGVTVLRDTRFTSLTRKDGLSDNLVRCVYEDRNGAVWAGTDNGLNRISGGTVRTFTTNDGLSSNVILSLGESADGRLLAGTPDGLNILENTGARVLTLADGLADDFVRSLYRDSDGSVWIGTRHGLSHSTSLALTAPRFTTYTQASGLGSDLVGTILRTKDGSVWIGTLEGLTRLQGSKLSTLTRSNGLSDNVITALAEDGNGSLWIGTQGGGLNRLAAGKIFRYPGTLGLPDVIYGIAEDAKQNLWMSAKTGIYAVNRSELDRYARGQTNTVIVASYGVADGLIVSECSGEGHPGIAKRRDGSLWFATVNGLATIDPRQMNLDRPAPQVVIESVMTDDSALGTSDAAGIPPGHSHFAFEYAGLSFIAPYNLKFKYRLIGFDRDWLSPTSRRVAYYTNLGPGKYQFEVMARSNDGVWNRNPATFSFRLLPHFYQTSWFYSALVLLALAFTYAAYRWRVTQVKSQFDLVLVERNRIAREIHDTLAQGFVAVSLQLELVSRTLHKSPEVAQKLLKQAQTSVQQSLEEARRSIWELRSLGENKEDLASKLSQLVSQVSATTAIKASFQVSGTYRPLSGSVEHELVKIGQEAVANAVRHANARHLMIDLSFEPRKLHLSIADDGCGFSGEPESSPVEGHFGLKGMRERAERIEAKLTVKSKPNTGTQILVEAELK